MCMYADPRAQRSAVSLTIHLSTAVLPLNSAAMDASVLVGANSNGQVFVFEPGQVCNCNSCNCHL